MTTILLKYLGVSNSPIDSNTEVWHGCCLGGVELPGRERKQNNVRHMTAVQYVTAHLSVYLLLVLQKLNTNDRSTPEYLDRDKLLPWYWEVASELCLHALLWCIVTMVNLPLRSRPSAPYINCHIYSRLAVTLLPSEKSLWETFPNLLCTVLLSRSVCAVKVWRT